MFLTASLLAASVPAFAQAPPERIRGIIVSTADTHMVVRPASGPDVTVRLSPDMTVRTDTPTTLAAIKPGTTLAIVSHGPAGRQQAVAVRAMGPGVTIRMGVSNWDLPQSTMTNAVVEGETLESTEKTMTLRAGDQMVRMEVAPDASIALEQVGDKAALTPGAKVMVLAAPGSGDGLTARAVIVGLQGMTPPL